MSSSDDESTTLDREYALPQTTSRGPMLGRGLACTRCRKRKQRCDGKSPTCSNCQGASQICEYVTIVKPRRKPQLTAAEALAAKYARLQERYSYLLQHQSPPTTGASANSNSITSPASSTASASTSFSRDSPPSFNGNETGLAGLRLLDTDVDAPSTNTSPSSPFGPTGFESVVHDPLVNAVLVDDMPPQDRDTIIRIFFTGSQRLGCPILPERFFARLHSPEEAHNRPHPALVNAMLLVGLAFTSWTPGYSTAKKWDVPASTPPADVLLAKTRAHLHESLFQVDRMLDHLQASILLSYYFFQSDRLVEGQNISATNSRMAVMCKLHQIDQAVLEEMLPGNAPLPGKSMWDASLLGRPADSYELGVRLWTFWQAWYYDSVFSLIMGTELVRDRAVPTTVFPRPSAAYNSGLAMTLRNTSFKELYENNPPQIPSPIDEPEGAIHPLATYLKALAIMERTNQYLAKVHRGVPLDDTFTPETLQKLHESLQCLLTEHLPIHEKDMLSTSTLGKNAACKIYCALAERIVGHVFVHTSTIQLCRLSRILCPGAEEVVGGLELDAARKAVRAMRVFGEEVRKLDNRMRGLREVVKGASVVTEVQEHPCLLLGFLLTSISMVLVDRIRHLKAYGGGDVMAELKSTEDDLALCINTITRTATSFPLLRTQTQKIEAYRDSERALDHEPQWEYERRIAMLTSHIGGRGAAAAQAPLC